jgi:uncharacterized protein (TIGR01777 family)
LYRSFLIKIIISVMKTIGITGGAGFVGKRLTTLLLSLGYEVVVFTRNNTLTNTHKGLTFAHWDPNHEQCDTDALRRLDAIVHLAGAGIADKRWTKERKKEIVHSRVHGTGFLASQLSNHAPDCKTFVAASAIGYYGPDLNMNAPFNESDPPATGFICDTCVKWEAAAQKAAHMRTVILRIGIVLGKESGAFPRLAQPLSSGIMPILGTGNQVVSWIAVDDLTRLMVAALENEELSGVYNAVAPNPVSHLQLMQAIAKAKGGLKIPVPAPSFILKLILGEMADEILKSCTVSAQKTLSTGFTFTYPEIKSAVEALV